ncbi:MAG: amidohydrolase family protein [Verrucomicrobiota bacterium]
MTSPSLADQWIRSDTILTLADEQNEVVDGFIQISDDGQILKIAQGEPSPAPEDSVIDATGKIILPGFVSGHNHLWQSAFRGIAPDEELYGWLKCLHWTYGEHFQDGDMYSFTLYGALDQLKSGITTTLNHSQTVAPTYENYMEQFDAEMDAGQHFVFSYVIDGSDSSAAARREKLVKLIEETEALEEPHACLDFGLHGVGIYRNMERHREEVELAKELDLDMQIHYLEEKAGSLERGQAKFPDLSANDGIWDGLVYAHFIHVTDEILEVSANAGAKMIWNPLSNGRLASGLADIPKYLDSGLAVGMGVDGSASADICDPFQNMRMGMYALRMRDSSAAVMSCYDILRLHTIKTAEVLDVDDRVGSLEPGKYADFLIVQPESPVFDPYATLVMATSASDIESVWVRGKPMVNRGTLLYHDMDRIKADVSERVALIVAAEIETNGE